jgi:pyruvate/2-oxoglutarate dehydrogenase complex dihydrolipoamide dehydrogenase (E3) component
MVKILQNILFVEVTSEIVRKGIPEVYTTRPEIAYVGLSNLSINVSGA